MRHVRSLTDLKQLAAADDRYARVLIYTAAELTLDMMVQDATFGLTDADLTQEANRVIAGFREAPCRVCAQPESAHDGTEQHRYVARW